MSLLVDWANATAAKGTVRTAEERIFAVVVVEDASKGNCLVERARKVSLLY